MSKLFQLRSYFTYWLDAVNEHSLHSPFFFDFFRQIIKAPLTLNPKAEQLRKALLADKRKIAVQDLGATSVLRADQRAVSDIARTSLSPARFSSLYRLIILQRGHKNIIELGTSLGINTLYLAEDCSTQVTTFEGNAEIASIAKTTFQLSEVYNINCIVGDIGKTLPSFLDQVAKVDFALMDANHRYEPTLRYFNLILNKVHQDSTLVIDDIHASAEMEQAWRTIRRHPLVYGTLDIYRCGIVLFDPSLNKQHAVLQH